MIKPIIGRPPEMIDIGVQHIKADPEAFMGPWLLGLVGLSFMMGVLTNQVTKYFYTFGYESTRLFLLVVSCTVLSVGQWVVVLIAEWDWSVAKRFAMVPWESAALPAITWLTVFTSQLFFASRCYTLYGHSKLIFGALLLGMTISLGIFEVFAAMIAIDPFNDLILHRIAISGLSVNVVTDVAITGLTLWKVRQAGNMYSPKTQHGLQRLRNMTLEAAVPPTICIILNGGFYIGMGNKNLISHWFAIVSPALYVWSMMFTLNSRPTIRQTFNASTQDEDKTLSTGFQFANSQSSDCRCKHGDVEKGAVVLAAMPDPIRSSININQELVGHHATAGNARSSRARDPDDELV